MSLPTNECTKLFEDLSLSRFLPPNSSEIIKPQGEYIHVLARVFSGILESLRNGCIPTRTTVIKTLITIWPDDYRIFSQMGCFVEHALVMLIDQTEHQSLGKPSGSCMSWERHQELVKDLPECPKHDNYTFLRDWILDNFYEIDSTMA